MLLYGYQDTTLVMKMFENRFVKKNGIGNDMNYLEIFYSKVVNVIELYKLNLILVLTRFNELANNPMKIMNLSSECNDEMIKTHYHVLFGMILKNFIIYVLINY